MICYDVADEESFSNCKQWLKEIDRHTPAGSVEKILVATKCDQAQRTVSAAAGQAFADSIGCPHFETSAKTGEGVETVFVALATQIATSKNPTLVCLFFLSSHEPQVLP